jgi:hypothetical protein
VGCPGGSEVRDEIHNPCKDETENQYHDEDSRPVIEEKNK